ncbi:MAG TPA: cupin domain-containing protein [Candidatus Anoxymicrobiaceae bacterium]|jgi:mannose-6-phosphate isomerase-like protein (cupin superfamily)
MISIVSYKDASVQETPHGVDVRKLLDSEHVQVIEIKLMPGEGLKKHITPVDVFFYVLEGTGIVEIGEEQAEVTLDQLVESPKGIPHRLMNESDSPFRFLVVKTPKPTASTRVL